MLDRDLQREILLRLREDYPDVVEIQQFLDSNEQRVQANLFYLEEHRLILGGAKRNVMGVPPQMLTAKITADGLDFLADDGGLGAILNVVTVRVEAETIREMLASGIRSSTAPEHEKATAIAKLRGFSADLLKSLVIKLVEKGIDNSEKIMAVMQLILKS
jgi:hypothetical protein